VRIELIIRMVDRNDVGDKNSQSLTLSEAIDEHGIECGVVLTHSSQKTQDDIDANDHPSLVVMK
jgi:hypothetical protein